MKKYVAILLVQIAFYFCCNYAVAKPSSVCDSLFAVYDMEVERSMSYIQKRQDRIDSLMILLPYTNDRYKLNYQLYEQYLPYKSSEALKYLSENRQIASDEGDLDKLFESTVLMSYMLASMGSFSEALYVVDLLPAMQLKNEQKSQLYDCYCHIYGEAGFYSKVETIKQSYFHIADLYSDSLMQILSDTAQRKMRLKEDDYRNMRLFDKALAINDTLLRLAGTMTHDYAKYAYQRSDTYLRMGNTDRRMEWLLLSAIADVRNGITDNGSSWMLAQMCFNNNELKRAYNYINYSTRNSTIYGAPMRIQQIAPLLEIIGNAHQQQAETQHRRLILLLSFVTVLSLLLALSLFFIFRRNRQLKVMHRKLEDRSRQIAMMNSQLQLVNGRLSEANSVKEKYIARYLNLYSEYIDRLKKMVKKPEFSEQEIEHFYQVFDDSFLSIYPDFVQQFNELLQPDKRIQLKKNEKLNTELRVFAMIRLGISSSSQIAQLLRYSPNTIYNYRAQIKNAALVNRDDFEQQVMKIGT